VDIISAKFAYNKERESVTDFTYLYPNEKLITILSSPQIVPQYNILTIFGAFQFQVWISIFVAYILVFTVNSIRTRELRQKLFIAIDYFVVLLGQGKEY